MYIVDAVSSSFRTCGSLILGRPTNFSWVIDGSLAASGFPSGKRSLRWLREQGIVSILSLTPQRIDERYARQLGMDTMRVPMVNLKPAEPEALSVAVRYMEEVMGKGGLLVHCMAGVGRTGMVLAAYFVKASGLSAQEAIDRVRALRPGSISRPGQAMAVAEYERSLRKIT